MKQSKALLVVTVGAIMSAIDMQAMNDTPQPLAKRESEVLLTSSSQVENELNFGQTIEERLANLESIVGYNPGIEQKRGIKKSAKTVLEKLKKALDAIKGIRKDVKSHEEKIGTAMQGLESVGSVLGNPSILGKLSERADSAFEGIVQIDSRVVAQAQALQLLREQLQPQVDLFNQAMKGEVQIPELTVDTAPQMFAQCLVLCSQMKNQLDEQKGQLDGQQILIENLKSRIELPGEIASFIEQSANDKQRKRSKHRSLEKREKKEE